MLRPGNHNHGCVNPACKGWSNTTICLTGEDAVMMLKHNDKVIRLTSGRRPLMGGRYKKEVTGVAYAVSKDNLLVATVVWANGCLKERSKGTCVSYSFKVGLLDDNEATCVKWPAMKMHIESRWIKADTVHCSCTPESFPKVEKDK